MKTNYIDQADFTKRVYAYVCKLNPIKFYNEIYRYHSEEINPIPVKDEKWQESCDVYFEFKNKTLEKSKKKREENRAKLNLEENTNYDDRLQELESWRLEVESFPVEGYMIEPQIPDDIAYNIMQICYKLANKYSYYQYTCKEDMIGTAIYKCCRYIGNFSACCGGNAMNYFTQIASRNFLKVISKEKLGWNFMKYQCEKYMFDNEITETELNTLF
jgi:hypothetical protein